MRPSANASKWNLHTTCTRAICSTGGKEALLSVAAQQGLQVGNQLGAVPVLRPDDFPCDPPVAVDDVGFRVHEGAVMRGNLLRGIAVGGEADLVFPQKVFIRGGVFIHADPQHHAALRAELPVQPAERSHLGNAGRTPGGPEVEHDDPSAQVHESRGVPVQFEREIGRLAARDARLALAVAGRRKDQHDRHRRAEREPAEQFFLQRFFSAPYNTVSCGLHASRFAVPASSMKTTVSAIVPARDEEATIARAVASLAEQPEIAEIIVVNDQSADSTAAVLQELTARVPQLRLLQTRELPPGWVGKSYALSLGAAQAAGEWLLFTDADAVHLPGSTARALADAATSGAALASYSPEQEMHTWWERAMIPFVYCRLAQRFSFAEVSDPSSPVAAANGQYLLIRRDAYEAIGGHRSVSGDVLEDVALARRAKQAGFRLYFAPGQGIARTRMYRSFAAMWQGWTKNL